MARFIGYPDRQVVAVIDDEEAAARAIVAIEAAGVAATAVARYEGPADAERFDATGARHGLGARIRRITQFSLMDQLPALAWYEAALRSGRIVVAVRTRHRRQTLEVVKALRLEGAHFINHFGRVATEEFARWRGPEPDVPNLMKH